MAEKEEEEVRAYLESAVKAGKIKAKPVAGKLDKKAVLEEARLSIVTINSKMLTALVEHLL
jgi:hypothetical protein